MATAQDIITQALFDLGAIAAGETPSASESADGLVRLNQMLLSWSTEGAVVPNQVVQSFPLSTGVSAYTLGSGGTLPTTGGLRAQKVVAWIARNSDQQRGGPALALDQFAALAAAAQKELTTANVRSVLTSLGAAADSILAAPVPPVWTEISTAFAAIIAAIPLTITAPIPSLVGADTAYPLINVRIWPPPGSVAGNLELAYWTPLTTLATLATVISLAPGFEDALHFNLAVRLAQYARASGIDPALAANAQNTKAAIMQQNTMERLQQAQPQQQQQ